MGARSRLARIAEQMKTQPVCLDCYPYNASSTILEQALVDGAARVIVTWSKAHPVLGPRPGRGRARAGLSVEEAVRRLQPAGAIYFRMHEDDVARILQFDETMVGSDGLPHDETPHPRLWGSFPRVLGHYARGLGLFPLEKAIHKMTGLTAARFGLADRGVLREGAHADLVLLDAGQVADRATFAQPIAPSAGIVSVWTNGRPVWRDGKTTASGRGRCCVAGLMRDRDARSVFRPASARFRPSTFRQPTFQISTFQVINQPPATSST